MSDENGLAGEIFDKIMRDQFSQRILENNLRGTFAEYLVAEILGEGWSVKPGSWNLWDLDGPDGKRLEVKSSAFLQTWTEEYLTHPTFRPSLPSFGISPHKYGLDGELLREPRRHADAYVFALHHEQDASKADQRRPEQWQFFVVPVERLPPLQKTISLASLRRLVAPVSAPELAGKVTEALNERQQMIGRLNHVAIAVPDLDKAVARYRDALGASVSEPQDLPEHGVRVVFIALDNTKIELLHPLGEKSPIAAYLDRHPDGGMHHVCYEVSDIAEAAAALKAQGARILGDGTPKIGAHGLPVLFLHPKDFDGTLIELEQTAA